MSDISRSARAARGRLGRRDGGAVHVGDADTDGIPITSQILEFEAARTSTRAIGNRWFSDEDLPIAVFVSALAFSRTEREVAPH